MRLYLVAPRADVSFGFDMPSGPDGRSVTPFASGAIATVAALAPPTFDVVVCDEMVHGVDLDADADIVGITANVSQARRAIELSREFRARGRRVVLGGAHVSLATELFEGHADSLVVGEFEDVAAEFFADAEAGALKPRYAGGKADLTRSPVPRWDLYPNDSALSGLLQTSRGCPFECNFCDVIQYLGRVQRHKTENQVLAELQRLYDFGYCVITLADDNLTVYRRRAKSLLSAIAGWNGAEGRDHVVFITQVSIDIARDPEILALCNDAGVLNLFLGIESNDESNLTESKKRQNLRVDLVEECSKVVRAGLRVESGLMVGFDSDDRNCFQRRLEFAMALPVANFNLSTLVAPVATPLYDAMLASGRIVSQDEADQLPAGNLVSNFRPAQMSREELYVGAKWLQSKLLDPEHFYARFLAMSRLLTPPPWQRRGIGRRRTYPSGHRANAMYKHMMRELARRDSRLAAMFARCSAVMRARPEIRDGLNDAIGSYVIKLHNYRKVGLYEPGWAAFDAPPFGTAPSDARLERLRAYA